MYGTLNINIPTIKPPLLFSYKPKIGFRSNTGITRRSMRGPCAVSVAATESRPASAGGSLYEVLRVDPKATMNEIKMAYRSLAKLYHPDLSGDGRDFIEIHNAYETLSDPSSREVYDLSLTANRRRRTRSTSYGYSGRSGFYPTRRWETDQCW